MEKGVEEGSGRGGRGGAEAVVDEADAHLEFPQGEVGAVAAVEDAEPGFQVALDRRQPPRFFCRRRAASGPEHVGSAALLGRRDRPVVEAAAPLELQQAGVGDPMVARVDAHEDADVGAAEGASAVFGQCLARALGA